MRSYDEDHCDAYFSDRPIRDYKSGVNFGLALAAVAIVYYIHNNDVKTDDFKILKHNLEAVLIQEEKKKPVDRGVRIKDDDIYRQIPKKIHHEKNYQKHLKNNFNRKMMHIPSKANCYASNNTVYKFVGNDKRKMSKNVYTII